MNRWVRQLVGRLTSVLVRRKGVSVWEGTPLREGGVSPAREGATDTDALGDILKVSEVDEAEFFVGDLFRRRFHTEQVPDYPRHFVVFYRPGPDQALSPLGYVHFTPWEGCHLGGGMVFDERAWRRICAEHRARVRAQGGVADFLLRKSLDRVLPDSIAVWGHVGDIQAAAVDRRVGFQDTGRPHLMVLWGRELPERQRAKWIRRAETLGPF